MSVNSISTTDYSCSGNHHKRLLIGEGNFSCALNLINKHDKKANHSLEKSLGKAIVATEFKSNIVCEGCERQRRSLELFQSKSPNNETLSLIKPKLCGECSLTTENIEQLKKKGVDVRLGIDGTKIDTIQGFKGNFPRIHWVCPHDGSSYKDQKLGKLIQDFMSSCRELQNPGDRVYITIPQNKRQEAFRQGGYYGIASAAFGAGYTLIKKRKFSERYRDYQHVTTNKEAKKPSVDSLREFVFEKVNDKIKEDASKFVLDNKKSKSVGVDAFRVLQKTSAKKCEVVDNGNYFS